MQSLIVKLIAITTTLVTVTALQLDSESQVYSQSKAAVEPTNGVAQMRLFMNGDCLGNFQALQTYEECSVAV